MISPIDKVVYIAEVLSVGDSEIQKILTTALSHGLDTHEIDKLYNIIKIKQ